MRSLRPISTIEAVGRLALSVAGGAILGAVATQAGWPVVWQAIVAVGLGVGIMTVGRSQ